jgi:hypothetical protein
MGVAAFKQMNRMLSFLLEILLIAASGTLASLGTELKEVYRNGG